MSSSLNLKPLKPGDDAHAYLSKVVLLPTKLQRTQALQALTHEHLEAALNTIEALLIGDNILQRQPALSLCKRVLELQRRDLLYSRLNGLLSNSSFPLRNIIWLVCRLRMTIPENTVLRLYTHSDQETVLPYLFHLNEQKRWSKVLENLFLPHPDIHVRLWTKYFSRRHASPSRSQSDSHHLTELLRLNDSRVKDWVSGLLAKGEYDADILSVLIEAPDANHYDPLWRAIWRMPRHQRLSLKALDALTPFDTTSTEVLFRRARAAASQCKRQYFIDKLAQRASKVVFHQASSLCHSLDQDARLLGVQILSVFGSPWHSARSACTQLLLERLNDPALKVRKAAVEGLCLSERRRIQRHQSEALSPHDETQLNRAWDNLIVKSPTHAIVSLSDRSNPSPYCNYSRNASSQSLSPGLAPLLTKGRLDAIVRERSYSRDRPLINRLFKKTPPVVLFIGLMVSTLSFSMHAGLSEFDKAQGPLQPSISGSKSNLKLSTSFSLDSPLESTLRERSETWYLYHRYTPETSASYVAKGPTPQMARGPHWELYSRWLLPMLHQELHDGGRRKVAQFLTTLLLKNPGLANVFIREIILQLPESQRDEVAMLLLMGGNQRLNVGPLHPAMRQLEPRSRVLLTKALSLGWITQDERDLSAKLKQLALNP